MQKQDDDQWRPVAYASRAMGPTEQCYAQIEKEALGIMWASERFADYLIGLKYHTETDHKMLVPLLSTKNLDKLPASTAISDANDAVFLEHLTCT